MILLLTAFLWRVHMLHLERGRCLVILAPLPLSLCPLNPEPDVKSYLFFTSTLKVLEVFLHEISALFLMMSTGYSNQRINLTWAFSLKDEVQGFCFSSMTGCSQLKLLWLANTTAIAILSINPWVALWFGYFTHWNLIILAEANQEVSTWLQHLKSWASYSGYPVVWNPIQM